MEFKVGDRVKCVRILADSRNALGQVGTVITVFNKDYSNVPEYGKKIYVKFEELGHWNVGANALELASPLSDEEMFWRKV